MNKLALLVKDEEGMTLVELLAVIVILSIVAAIGGVAISGVIQRSREDGRVADVNMLYEAATLAEASDSYISKKAAAATPVIVSAKDLKDNGFATSVNFLADKTGKDTSASVTFSFSAAATGAANSAPVLKMNLPQGAIMAGAKESAAVLDADASTIKSLTRETLFKAANP